MPQTDFFCDFEDERSLVTSIFDQGGWLVASSQKLQQYEPITTWTAYETARVGGGQRWALENERLFLVLSESYQECPLDLHVIKEGHYKGSYSVTQRVGGPTIELFTSTIRANNRVNQISDGFLSYYATYKNTFTGEVERSPDSLIRIYKAIVECLKERGITIKGRANLSYLIGPHTYPRVRSGELVLGVRGLELPAGL